MLRAEVVYYDWKLRMNMKEERDMERGVNLRPGAGKELFRNAVRVQCVKARFIFAHD